MFLCLWMCVRAVRCCIKSCHQYEFTCKLEHGRLYIYEHTHTDTINKRYVVLRWHVVGHGLWKIHQVNININYYRNDLSEAIHLAQLTIDINGFEFVFSFLVAISLFLLREHTHSTKPTNCLVNVCLAALESWPNYCNGTLRASLLCFLHWHEFVTQRHGFTFLWTKPISRKNVWF